MDPTPTVIECRSPPVEGCRRVSRFAVFAACIALLTSTPMVFAWAHTAEWTGASRWLERVFDSLEVQVLTVLLLLPILAFAMSLIALGRAQDAPLKGRRLSVAAIVVSGLSASRGGCIGFTALSAANC
jgi:hypothetical protein